MESLRNRVENQPRVLLAFFVFFAAFLLALFWVVFFAVFLADVFTGVAFAGPDPMTARSS